MQITKEQVENGIYDYEFRRRAAKEFQWFCLLYLPHYFNLEPADFHADMLAQLSDASIRILLIEGFRGSAKSTAGSLALPLWLALEYPDQYPFIIPCADTSTQSALNVANIKHELDNNELIKSDYGNPAVSKKAPAVDPKYTLESEEEWQSKNMLLSNGVRILARSRGQKIRGLRHRQHRPTIAIIDDPEDLEWVRNKENRDKTDRWLTGEVMPAIDERAGRMVVIGNRLHNDALMERIKKRGIATVLEYPLINKDGTCAWPAKYPTPEALARKKKEMGESAWQREMLLRVIPDEGQVIKEEWIQYYDEIPQREYDPKTKHLISNPILSTAVGNDLAISKKATADCTTFVGGVMAVQEKKQHIFILPNPINQRLNFQETIATGKAQYEAIKQLYGAPMFYTEDVAYQHVAVEMLQAAGIPVQGVKVGTDKRARLMLAAPFIESGMVLFPRKGAEDLIGQILGFGIEDHDDLLDSFVHMVLGINSQGGMQPLDVIQIA